MDAFHALLVPVEPLRNEGTTFATLFFGKLSDRGIRLKNRNKNKNKNARRQKPQPQPQPQPPQYEFHVDFTKEDLMAVIDEWRQRR